MSTIHNASRSLPLTSTYAPFDATDVQAGVIPVVRPSLHAGNNGVVNPGWNHFYYDSTHVYLPMRLPYSASPFEQVSSVQGTGLTNPSPHASFNHNGQGGGLRSIPGVNFHPQGYRAGQDWRSWDQSVYTNLQGPRVPTTGPSFQEPRFYGPPGPLIMAQPRPVMMHGQHFIQPVAPSQLKDGLQKQIHHYFSHENLVKDLFLRHNMDAQGWVSITLIANFRKVKALTDDVSIIEDALKQSDVVEVEGEKVRRRNDWKDWLLPSSFPVESLLKSVSTESISSTKRVNW